jgi:hypothetical protein
MPRRNSLTESTLPPQALNSIQRGQFCTLLTLFILEMCSLCAPHTFYLAFLPRYCYFAGQVMLNERSALLPKTSARRLQKRWSLKMRFLAMMILFTLFITLTLPDGRLSVPDAMTHDFGVGFDLTTSYRYVAAKYSTPMCTSDTSF